ncbi:hypothetical protein [Tenacibaculum crassostreae]|uniref:hypothetical protein n=1 Tax=Tenacibaculum crassostreae TaxID=502683 RepID=UPI0038B68F36
MPIQKVITLVKLVYLSIRGGEKPSIESLKALSSLFEFYIAGASEQLKEEAYYKKVKSFIFKLGLFLTVQIIMIVDALDTPTSWDAFFVVLFYCSYFLRLSANDTFTLSDRIKKLLTDNKFK